MWAYDVLGLEPAADERAVKRAYAARLKVTRPEDDPEGFARLVEARDAAIHWARYIAERPEVLDEERDEVASIANGEPFPSPLAGEGGGRPDEGGPSQMDSPSSAPVGAPSPTRGEGEACQSSGSERHVPGDPPPPPVTGLLPGEEAAIEVLEDPAPLVASAVAEVQRDTVDLLMDRVRQRFASWSPADRDAWDLILADADALSFAMRQEFEIRLSAALNQALPDMISGTPEIPSSVLALVERIGTDFGWMRDSRRLVGFFWPSDGSQILPRLIYRILSRLPEPEVNDSGLPIIDRFDLNAYFGGPQHPTLKYYDEARRHGRLGPSWNWVGLMTPAIALAHHGRLVTVGALLFLFGVLPAIVLHDERMLPWLLWGHIAHAVAVAALHVAIALYARRISILRLADLSRRAMKTLPYRDEERARFLKKNATTGQFITFLAAFFFMVLIDIPAWQGIAQYF